MPKCKRCGTKVRMGRYGGGRGADLGRERKLTGAVWCARCQHELGKEKVEAKQAKKARAVEARSLTAQRAKEIRAQEQKSLADLAAELGPLHSELSIRSEERKRLEVELRSLKKALAEGESLIGMTAVTEPKVPCVATVC